MHYLRPSKGRPSAWIVMFNSSLAAYALPMDFYIGIVIHMSLGIDDIYDSVRPPRGSHEDIEQLASQKL